MHNYLINHIRYICYLATETLFTLHHMVNGFDYTSHHTESSLSSYRLGCRLSLRLMCVLPFPGMFILWDGDICFWCWFQNDKQLFFYPTKQINSLLIFLRWILRYFIFLPFSKLKLQTPVFYILIHVNKWNLRWWVSEAKLNDIGTTWEHLDDIFPLYFPESHKKKAPATLNFDPETIFYIQPCPSTSVSISQWPQLRINTCWNILHKWIQHTVFLSKC